MSAEKLLDDWIDVVESNSKQGTGLGINLSNIRPRGATISSSAPSGVSSLITSYDVASMYPSMMGNTYDINDPSYHVAVNYPFEVKRMNINDVFSGGEDWHKSKSFSRRYDAEKHSLEKQCEWSDGDWEQDLRNKKKLETFDEDHPEWII